MTTIEVHLDTSQGSRRVITRADRVVTEGEHYVFYRGDRKIAEFRKEKAFGWLEEETIEEPGTGGFGPG